MFDVAKVLLIQLDKPHLAGGICSVIPRRVQSKQFKAVTRLCGLQIEFANWPGPGGVGVKTGSKQGLDGAPQSSACSFHVCAMLCKYLFKYFRWCLTCLQSFCQFPALSLSPPLLSYCYGFAVCAFYGHFNGHFPALSLNIPHYPLPFDALTFHIAFRISSAFDRRVCPNWFRPHINSRCATQNSNLCVNLFQYCF